MRNTVNQRIENGSSPLLVFSVQGTRDPFSFISMTVVSTIVLLTIENTNTVANDPVEPEPGPEPYQLEDYSAWN